MPKTIQTLGIIVGCLTLAGITIGISRQLSGTPIAAEHDPADGHYKTSTAAEPTATDYTAQSVVAIDIQGFVYSPTNITVKKGTKITWTNHDVIKHNVMQAHGNDDHAHDAPTPDEVRSDIFAGPMLAKGESYSFTFAEAGSFPYHCAPHPTMVGSVTVVE